jgi:hypothetical protein
VQVVCMGRFRREVRVRVCRMHLGRLFDTENSAWEVLDVWNLSCDVEGDATHSQAHTSRCWHNCYNTRVPHDLVDDS